MPISLIYGSTYKTVSLMSVSYTHLDKDMLKEFILNKPEALELVLTGRDPADYMIEAADYVTEMKKIKHPFDAGIPARLGVEW